jgi:3-oxoacyl-(acyl-carrier-protein) synthase
MAERIFLTTHEVATAGEPQLMADVAYPQYVHWLPETYQGVASGLHYPPARMAARVLTPEVKRAIQGAAAQDGRSAFLLAAGNTNFVGLTPRKFKPDGPLAYTYKMLPLSLTNIYAARVAQELGCADHIATDATACASAIKSLMDAVALIRLHGYERVAVLAVEDQVNTVMLEFFGETRAVLTLAEMERDGVQPSAFDPKNRGFFIGQGAAFALLETERSMRAGARAPLAELKSATVVAERHGNAVGQRDDGAGYRDAIAEALRLADAPPHSVKLIKTHGTGTPSNNVAETAGIRAAFGDDFTATSYKQRIGHTMGPSGLIELVLALRDAQQGVARGIPNRTGGDKRFLPEDEPMRAERVLVLASGMGNVFGAAVCDRTT